MTYKPEPGADPEQGTPETEVMAYATVAEVATTSTFTAAVKPTPVSGTTVPADTPMRSQTKQGSKCCGCCCDYRRAVIILNILYIIYGIISVIVNTAAARTAGGVDFDDDGLYDIVEDTYRQQAILAGVGLFTSIVALAGANRYNIHMVGFNILYLIVSFIATIVLTNEAFNTLEEDYNGDEDIPRPALTFVIQGLVLCIVIYPHVGFIYEVKAGILSAETYPREATSCCCAV